MPTHKSTPFETTPTKALTMRLAITLAVAVSAVGCGDASTSPTEATAAKSTVIEVTPAAFNIDGAPTVEIGVDMHCGGCAAGVCKTLKEQPGVVDAKADADTDIATIAIDKSTFDAEATLAALAEANYSDAVLKAAEEAEDTAEEAPVEDVEEPTDG